MFQIGGGIGWTGWTGRAGWIGGAVGFDLAAALAASPASG
jgi:hypothetical protein